MTIPGKLTKTDYILKHQRFLTREQAEQLEMAYYAAKHAAALHGVELSFTNIDGTFYFYPTLRDDNK